MRREGERMGVVYGEGERMGGKVRWEGDGSVCEGREGERMGGKVRGWGWCLGGWW